MNKITREQFVEQQPDTIKFFELIKPKLPAKIVDLNPLVTYTDDREACEAYCWSMLSMLRQFNFIKMLDGVVEIA